MSVELVAQRHRGQGPVEKGMLRLVSSNPGDATDVSIAERSPVGPRAVRIQCRGTDSIAARLDATGLASKPEVDAVVSSPPNIYVRVRTETLLTWVGASFSERCEAAAAPVPVTEVRCATTDGGGLCAFRESAVGASLAALRGWHRAKTDETRLVRLGGVEAVQGPLRLRCGGVVVLDDLFHEARSLCASDEALAVAFVFLRTATRQHIRIDQSAFTREISNYCEVERAIARMRMADGSCENHPPHVDPSTPECAVRDLAMELNAFPRAIGRACVDLEPAHIAKALKTLAATVVGLPEVGLPRSLRSVITEALAKGLWLLGLQEELSPASIRGGEHD